MIDYVSILKKNPNGVFATQENGKVKTRVFQYLFADNNKVYFCTSNQKSVYKQLNKVPYASFCTYPKDLSEVISVNGSVVFVNDLSLKTRALDENIGIKEIYKTPDNPVFEIFYIAVEEIETFSFTNGPITYTI